MATGHLVLEYDVARLPELEAECARLSAEVVAIDAALKGYKDRLREGTFGPDHPEYAEYARWKVVENERKLASSARLRNLQAQLSILRAKASYREQNKRRARFIRAAARHGITDAEHLLALCIGILIKLERLGYIERREDKDLILMARMFLDRNGTYRSLLDDEPT